MPSGFGLNAFTRGAMQGANFVAGIQGRQALQQERERRDERSQQRFELGQRLTDYKLQGLSKARSDADALRKLTAAQYALTAGQDPAVAHAIQANPKFRQLARDGMEIAAHQVVGEGGPAGAKKTLNKLVPLPNGKLAVDLNVTRTDGTTYTAPVTEGRADDPNEPVAQFTPQQLIQGIGNQKAAIAMIQAARIAHGDTSPIQQAQTAKEIQAKHDWEIKKMLAQARIDQSKAGTKLQNSKELASYKADLTPEKPTYKQDASGNLYAVQGSHAAPVMVGGGYGLAPMGKGVTPEEIATDNSPVGGLMVVNPPALAQGTQTAAHPLQLPAGADGGHAPALVQSVEWIAQNLTGGDMQSAYRVYNQGKSNPRELAAGIYSRLAAQNAKLFDTQQKTPDELWAQTQAIVQHIYSSPLMNPLAGGQTQPTAPQSTAAQTAPAQELGAQTSDLAAANTPPVAALNEGRNTTFANGQTWTLVQGRPVQVR